jgi:transcription elongation GreA/GreB family factor
MLTMKDRRTSQLDQSQSRKRTDERRHSEKDNPDRPAKATTRQENSSASNNVVLKKQAWTNRQTQQLLERIAATILHDRRDESTTSLGRTVFILESHTAKRLPKLLLERVPRPEQKQASNQSIQIRTIFTI